MVYASNKKPADYRPVFTLVADPKNFLRPALATTAVAKVLLFLGVWGQIADEILGRLVAARETEAVVAALLVVPSVYAFQITRRGEHPVRSMLLRWPRYALLSTVIAVGIAITSLVCAEFLLPWALSAFWMVSAVWNMVVFAYYGVLWLSISRQVNGRHAEGPGTVNAVAIETFG